MAAAHPMLVKDVGALRRKIDEAKGSLAAKWRGFLTLAEHQADAHPLYPAFAALVTEDPQWSEAFRRRLEAKVNGLPTDALHGGCQFHTWCWCAPLARWTVAYDWVADLPAFADFDHRRCADAFIDAIHSQVYPRVLGRVPACDNQIGSMLLACGVVGYLFGVKRGQDPRAVKLYQVAMERVGEIAALAEAQFVGEGSGYMGGVNAAVMGLWYAFLDWLGKPFDRATWLGCQESGRNLIAPGGQMLGWDAGGNVRAFNLAGLTLLARETGTPAPLAAIDHLDLWHGLDHCAWHEDQRLWTLLWWPDDAPENPLATVPPPQVFPGWFHPHIGGALDDGAARLRIAQLWDICSGPTVGSVGRPNVDPSALSLYVDGSPLLLDGGPGGPVAEFDYPAEKMLTAAERAGLERFVDLRRQVSGGHLQAADVLREFTHGCVGGSNALVFNREPWHFPRRAVHGQGTLWARLERVQAVAADCAEHYRPRYPVNRVERATLMLDRRFALVVDTVEADAPLETGWQAFVRHEAVAVEAGRVVVHTPEGPGLVIVPEAADTLETTRIDNYPKPFDASVRVAWRKTLAQGTLATLLAPHDDERLAANSAVWEGALAPGWDGTGTTIPKVGDGEWTAHGGLEAAIEALWSAPAAVWRLLRCRMRIPHGADYLRLPLLNEQAGLWRNGLCVVEPDPAKAGKSWGRCLPLALATGVGEMELVIATPSHCGRLQVGAGEWYRRTPLPETTLDAGEQQWTVRCGDWHGVVSTGNAAAARGWDTDARWVVEFGDGGVALLAATRARHASFAEFATGTLAHAEWGDGAWRAVTAALPEATAPWPAAPVPCTEAVAGEPLTACPETAAVCQALRSSAPTELLAWLDSPDWRVQRAAIERLGELGSAEAAPRLRDILAREVTLPLNQPPPNRPPSGDWAADMRDLGRDLGNRRFRVLQALLVALRQLGNRDCLPLVRELLRTSHHFYPTYKAALDLLAELGQPADQQLLEYWADYPETNASAAARAALKKKL